MTHSVPIDGSRWVWEIDKDHVRVLLEVVETRWTDGDMYVITRTLPDFLGQARTSINDLSRFWEAVTPVGGTVNMLSEIRLIKE